MLAAFIQRLPSVSRVVLLDPEDGVLSEAAREIGALESRAEVLTHIGSADEEAIVLAREADVGLAVHVVYLLPHARFRSFVQHWPPDVPLYVVLDSPNSVFSALWKHTAQDFAARSARVHEYLAGEANHGLLIRRTEFATRVANPFELEATIRNLVLSLLCYCDYDDLPQGKKVEVEQVIRQHAEGNEVACACTCYELLRGMG